jgi:hypothetical protein
MVLFLGFSFEFFIRGDKILGAVMIFNGIVNLLAFQQVPRRIASITVILNLFNAMIALTVAYNYQDINYSVLFISWLCISIAYAIAVIRQIYSLVASKRSRKRQKDRIS